MGRNPNYLSPSIIKRNASRNVLFKLRKQISELQYKLCKFRVENILTLSKLQDRENRQKMSKLCIHNVLPSVDIPPNISSNQKLGNSSIVRTSFPVGCNSCQRFQCSCDLSCQYSSVVNGISLSDLMNVIDMQFEKHTPDLKLCRNLWKPP